MKIGIIGVGGVGMAHVVAAERAGHEVVCIIDNDKTVLDNAKGEWCNIWNTVRESVPVREGCEYGENTSILRIIDNIDLLIIATPPHSHEELIRKSIGPNIKKIMVEKPIGTGSTINIKDNSLSMSAEWMNHSGLSEVKKIEGIGMRYILSAKGNWGYRLPALFDFAPHLMSILYSKGYKIQKVKVITKDINRFAAEVFCKDLQDPIVMFGDRTENAGLLINLDINLKWENDLFDKQINKGEGLPWKIARQHHELIRKYW